jgi:23S rRNA pseudouridine2605 synthase
MQERVQKIIAAAGITSRRAAEKLILEGRVRVNGAVVTEMGVKADPDKDHIKVDGKLINPKQQLTYVMLNKPVGHITTMADPERRPMVSDLLKGVRARVYPVGRLDYNTEGLLLLTNDGDFAHLVTHPSHELPKTYLVKVKGVLGDRDVEMLEKGVFLQDGKTAPARVRRLRKEEANSWVEITIHEGRKRQVRRMIDHTGHSVIKLKRTRIGNLDLGDLAAGTYRYLSPEEVAALRDLARGPERPVLLPAAARVPKAAADWKNMEVEAIPGPAKRVRKPVKARPAAAVRSPGKERAGGKGFPPREERAGEGRAQRSAHVRQRSDQRPGERRPWQGEQRSERPAFPGRGSASRTTGTGAGASFRPRETGKRPFGERAQRPGGRRPWQGEQRGERPAVPGRGPASRTARTGASASFRPRETGKRPFGERAQRPEGRRPWQGEQRGDRPAFPGRGPSPRTTGPRPGASFRQRPTDRKPFGEAARQPAQRGQRPEGRGAWQGAKGAGRPFEGARRPFVKKGPRPAGGPAPGGRGAEDRSSRYGKPGSGSRERTESRGAWQGEARGARPSSGGPGRASAGRRAGSDKGTFPREGRGSSFGARAARPEGKRPWQSPGASARPGTRETGARPGIGRPAGGGSGSGRPGGFRPPKGRGPKRG